jgi:hypothetical protein
MLDKGKGIADYTSACDYKERVLVALAHQRFLGDRSESKANPPESLQAAQSV